MSNTTIRFAERAEAVLERVESVDLLQEDAEIAAIYIAAVDEALDIAIRARGAGAAQYQGTDARDYEVIRDSVRAMQVARYVFEQVTQRCAVPYRDRDSLIACAYSARSAAQQLASA